MDMARKDVTKEMTTDARWGMVKHCTFGNFCSMQGQGIEGFGT